MLAILQVMIAVPLNLSCDFQKVVQKTVWSYSCIRISQLCTKLHRYVWDAGMLVTGNKLPESNASKPSANDMNAAQGSIGEISNSLAKLKRTVVGMQQSLSQSSRGAPTRRCVVLQPSCLNIGLNIVKHYSIRILTSDSMYPRRDENSDT